MKCSHELAAVQAEYNALEPKLQTGISLNLRWSLEKARARRKITIKNRLPASQAAEPARRIRIGRQKQQSK
jgi:hypothetical protein